MSEPDENDDAPEGRSSDDAGDADANRGALGRVTAHALALKAADHAWEDALIIRAEPLLAKVAEQLMRSASAIAAHIADGYGRRSPRDRTRFYEYALSENAETETWYRNGRYVLSPEILEERIARLTSIRRLLLTMIKNERGGGGWNNAGKRPT